MKYKKGDFIVVVKITRGSPRYCKGQTGIVTGVFCSRDRYYGAKFSWGDQEWYFVPDELRPATPAEQRSHQFILDVKK